jgi:hypothetical protein
VTGVSGNRKHLTEQACNRIFYYSARFLQGTVQQYQENQLTDGLAVFKDNLKIRVWIGR